MSKDQKQTVQIPVETVENLDYMLTWITTTITFWNLNKNWPCNLIQTTTDEMIKMLKPYWNDPFKNVSSSHINDK